MTTKETRAQRGRRRGREMTAGALAELRSARVSSGLSQRALGRAIGCTQQHYSKIERGLIGTVSLVDLSTVAAVLGVEPTLTFHPVGPAIRDKGHEALIRRLLAIVSSAWTVTREAAFPNPGDPRSWDVLLRRGTFIVGIEAETRIRDVQALVRRMRERGRDGEADAMVLVLSDSTHNRALVDDVRAALGRAFAARPGHLLRALRDGRPLPGSGVILL